MGVCVGVRNHNRHGQYTTMADSPKFVTIGKLLFSDCQKVIETIENFQSKISSLLCNNRISVG